MFAFVHSSHPSASFMACKDNMVAWDITHNGRLAGWIKVHSGSTSVPENRNSLVKEFLDTSTAEWLLMVDADMGFAPDALDRMLEVADRDERPIIGAMAFANRHVAADPYGGWTTRAYPTILDWQKFDDGISRFVGRSHYPPNALVKCGATGAAFLLMHRNVLEVIGEKYGRHWFTRQPDPGGEMMGEDVSFFARCAALGIPLHVHTGIQTTHHKEVWLNHMDFWDTQMPDPATDPVAVIVPVLHRPQNVKPLMESLRASTGLATAYFVCDPDDEGEIAAVEEAGGVALRYPGSFAQKANYGYGYTTEPWLCFVGDDVRFFPGWLDHCTDLHRRYGKRFLATNDCHNPRVLTGEHATHPMVHRSYVDELGLTFDGGPGSVAHDGYGHCFVDDEWSLKAKADNEFMPAFGARVEHLHPLWTDGESDDVYDKGQSTYDADERLFEKRATRFIRERQGAN